MSDAQIAVTKKGFNVLTETDPKNFIFHSDYNSLKTAVSGSLTISNVTNGSESSQSIAHGLGIRPLVLAYFHVTTSDYWFIAMSNPEFSNARKSTTVNVECYVDATNVYFNAQNTSGSTKSVEILYEIFYEGDA